MEPVFILSAFLGGGCALLLRLPPLVGFLITGFILHYAGYSATPAITYLSDLGVTLLLFYVGIKLDVKTLLRKEIWFGSTLHNFFSTLFFFTCLFLLKFLGLSLFAGVASTRLVLLAFALSFSSTVFAIKVLEEKGEINAIYGSISIGILIMQDIFAVLYLTVSTGKVPGPEALVLLFLPFTKKIFYKILDTIGHGEMVVLYGIFLALIPGAGLFQLVGMKPDLGALCLGILIGGHKKSSEIAKSLFNLKELFLVCFFLNIGLAAKPGLAEFSMGVGLVFLLPIKSFFYYIIVRKFRFRLRTSLLTSLTLLNYSEFGLIVASLAVKMGVFPPQYLAILAIAVSASFIVSSPINQISYKLYGFLSQKVSELPNSKLNAADRFIELGDSEILILGMGRIGTSLYDDLTLQYQKDVIGIEVRENLVIEHQNRKRNVVHGDAIDQDFWENVCKQGKIRLILLVMPNSHAITTTLLQIKAKKFSGKVAGIVLYDDEMEPLKKIGLDAAYNVYGEAGIGFSRHILPFLETSKDKS
ncbi:MAG: cation:proton antiporter [Spirochaetota bacterium]